MILGINWHLQIAIWSHSNWIFQATGSFMRLNRSLTEPFRDRMATFRSELILITKEIVKL